MADPLYHSVYGDAFYLKARRHLVYGLRMKRVDHYFTLTTKTVKFAVFRHYHEMAFSELVFDVAFAGHPVVVEAVNLMDPVVKCSTHGDIYFLNAAARTKQRDTLRYALAN